MVNKRSSKAEKRIDNFYNRVKPFDTKPFTSYTPNRNEETGNLYPLCCDKHELIYEQAKDWLALQKEAIHKQASDKLEYEIDWKDYVEFPEKFMTKLAYTENFIMRSINKRNWYEEITNYIDYTVYSFGNPALSFVGYIACVRDFLEVNESKFKDGKSNQLLEFLNTNYLVDIIDLVSHEGRVSLFNDWLNIIPWELDFFAQFKSFFENTVFVIGEARYNRFLGIELNTLPTKEELLKGLPRVTDAFIKVINSHWWFEQGLLNYPEQMAINLVNAKRRMQIDKGYLSKPKENEEDIRAIFKRWFEEEKEYVMEIASIVKGKNSNSGKQERGKESTSIDTSPKIKFVSPDGSEKLYEIMKGCFVGYEEELRSLLDGKELTSKLVFPAKATQFIEVIRRVKYNNHLLNTSRQLQRWIVQNFMFTDVKGDKVATKNFNDNTVWTFLTKRADVSVSSRICIDDWIPWKSHSAQKGGKS